MVSIPVHFKFRLMNDTREKKGLTVGMFSRLKL